MSDNTTNLEYAPGWRPDEGDVITGRVLELSKGASQWGQYPIVVIRQDNGDGDVAVHGFHPSLKNRLLDLQPRKGERIGIQYKGKRDSKSHPGQKVAVYIVRIDGRDSDTAWAGLVPAGEPPQTPGTQLPMPPADDPQPEYTQADFDTAGDKADDDIPF